MLAGSVVITRFGGHSPSGAHRDPRTSTVEGFDPPPRTRIFSASPLDDLIRLLSLSSGHGTAETPHHPASGRQVHFDLKTVWHDRPVRDVDPLRPDVRQDHDGPQFIGPQAPDAAGRVPHSVQLCVRLVPLDDGTDAFGEVADLMNGHVVGKLEGSIPERWAGDCLYVLNGVHISSSFESLLRFTKLDFSSRRRWSLFLSLSLSLSRLSKADAASRLRRVPRGGRGTQVW